MTKVVKREFMLLALENDYNVEVVPDPLTDGILVEEPNWGFTDALRAERNPNIPGFGRERSIQAGELIQFTGTVELKGSGVAATAPEIGKLLQILGFTETPVGGNTLYNPASDNLKSATIYYYDQGSLIKATGVRGTAQLAVNVGEVGKLSFTLTGHYAGWEDIASPAFTYNATKPPAFKEITFTLGGVTESIEKFELDFGNEVEKPKSGTSPDAYGEIAIVDRIPTGSFDPTFGLKADKDWIDLWRTSGGEAAVLAWGNTVGNTIQINAGDMFYEEIPTGERNRLRTLDVAFACAGTPPFQIIFQ